MFLQMCGDAEVVCVEQRVRILMIFLNFMYFSAFFIFLLFLKFFLELFKVDLVIKLNSIRCIV